MTLHFQGKRLTGTVIDRFTSRRLRCYSGTVRFTAYLDGTPQAPLHAKDVGTGGYEGTAFSADVYLPLHLVTRFDVTVGLTCRNGGSIKGIRFRLNDVPITGSRFRVAGKPSLTLGHGYSGTDSNVFTGAFSAGSPQYLLRWRARNTLTVFLDGSRFTTCYDDTGGVAFGPRDL